MLIEGAQGAMRGVMVGVMVVGLIVGTVIAIPNVIAAIGKYDMDTPSFYWGEAAKNCDAPYDPTDHPFAYAGPSNTQQYNQCTATQFIGIDFFKLLAVGKNVGALIALVIGMLAFAGSLLFWMGGNGKVQKTK